MIKKFDKNGAVALNKRRFVECLEKQDCEGAFDKLLRYSELTDNPDFHLQCGMLYTLMTLDSDDRELLTLAFREFMMHIAAHPDCSVAYRNLLAVAFLRRDPVSVIEVSSFIVHSGFDVAEMADELGEYGLDMFIDDEGFIDLEGLFSPQAFGMTAGANPEPIAEQAEEISAPTNKVLRFRGTTDRGAENNAGSGKVQSFAGNDEDYPDSLFEMMLQVVKSESESEPEQTNAEDDVLADEIYVPDDVTSNADIGDKMAVREAQRLCLDGKFEEALSTLDNVRRDGGRLHYCAECIRANIMMETGRLGEAQDALNSAMACVPSGALAGTLQCRLHELNSDYELIPETLRGIDVTDYVDCDHVYKAMQYAVKYCTPDDAMDLAEEYIDEFNTFDIRRLYAQLLYNSGMRDEAKKEFYVQTRVLYDDFISQYYYLISKAGIEVMPVSDETPSNVLGIIVDNFISVISSGIYLSAPDILQSEQMRYSLEVFLTLEFRNTRKVMKIMFDTLRTVAKEKLMETAMRNALVSPYVEPLVKAVILGELLAASDGTAPFLTEQSFCPISSVGVPTLGAGYSSGYYTAYALTLMFAKNGLSFLTELARTVKDNLISASYDDRDVAYYLWRAVKTKEKFDDKEVESRLEYALGYDGKTQAKAAYKAFSELMRQQ